jgi:transcriptional regulator with XRE-family HTH domain
MGATAIIIRGIKSRLRANGISYRALARQIGVSEPTVKRDLSRGKFSLERLDRICEILLSAASMLRLQSSIRRVAAEFEQLAHQDARLPLERRDGCTVILAMSSWEFSEFSKLRRAPRTAGRR